MIPTTLRARAGALHLHGLLAHWPEVATADWLAALLDWEEQERRRRSLERRLQDARIGRFKPLCDFDWTWPKRCDRAAIEALMTLDFLEDAGNVVLVGPNGVGKSTLAQNIAHQALIAGHTVLFTSAGQLLGDLCALDSDSALRRRLRHYARPQLLVIDEVGYLSYSNRHADLMFELVSRRYQNRSTLITTNRPFAEWREVFPNAACVVSLIDRLIHNAEIVAIRFISQVEARVCMLQFHTRTARSCPATFELTNQALKLSTAAGQLQFHTVASSARRRTASRCVADAGSLRCARAGRVGAVRAKVLDCCAQNPFSRQDFYAQADQSSRELTRILSLR